ncbi:glycosyltransferase [Spirosoma luteolum]
MNPDQPITPSPELAPIVLFAYRRPAELARTLAALRANPLAAQSELYVFVDGPRHTFDMPKVKAVQQLVDALDGFHTIHRHYAGRNRGLAASVIAGVSQVMAEHGRAIVLEDDLVTSPNFLDFMNQGLRQYQHQPRVFSLTGYTFAFDRPANYPHDAYLFPRTGSWGWATWADRWASVDWAVSDYDAFLADRSRVQAFQQYGSDRLKMLKRWRMGEIDSWAIRFCYAEARQNGLTVYPTTSKVDNIGFTGESTNTHGYNRYRTRLDTGTQQVFSLPDDMTCLPHYVQHMRWKFSLPVRAANRLLTHALKAQRWMGKSD